ncbi:ComF family protein [Candidatus Uhrbacteria bacterium]|nr:ComF family protein [Candidatus Uhrbacteria bacterium]
MFGSLTERIGRSKFTTLLLDIFFPRFCLGCRTHGVWVCQACEGTLPRYRPQSSHAMQYSKSLSFFRAAYSYDHWLTQSIVRTCKYEGVRGLADTMASALVREYQYIPSDGDEVVIIPVPLHERKQSERGFNQAELIALKVASILGKEVCATAVRRIRDTCTQVKLSREQRRSNVKGVFVCDEPHRITGKRVVLVDDISTTGSTLSEIAGVLWSAGVTDVIGLVFAHGNSSNEEAPVRLADHPKESLYG